MIYGIGTDILKIENIASSVADLHGDTIRLNEIKILENENGQPVVTLLGNAHRLAAEKGIARIFISLSYDTDYAIAYAAAVYE